MNKRYKLLKACDGTSSTQKTWADYKAARNKVTKMLHSAAAKYWMNIFVETKDSKSFWKTVNEATGKSKSKCIGHLNEVSSDNEKADLIS